MSKAEREIVHSKLERALKHECPHGGPCKGGQGESSKEILVGWDNARHRTLVGYLKAGDGSIGEGEQRQIIEAFCKNHGHVLKECFSEAPGSTNAFHRAMEALGAVDGLIVSDLNRIVEHPADRMRDIKPFLYHFLCDQKKHVVSVKEGIDTGTSSGQRAALEIFSQIKDSHPFELFGNQ